ncbi:MAG TPA: hypothetical protein DCR24_09360 [Bacillus bacterium]|nr:hypothetical protein [Bacillus sp. (in: firmicutes)]
MILELTDQEIEDLISYRFAPELPEKEGFKLVDFLNDSNLNSFLEKAEKQLRAEDIKVTASIFMKRQAFLAVIYLFSMSAFNKQLDVSLKNITLVNAFKNGAWLPEFHFVNKSVSVCQSEMRNEWRTDAIRHLFADSLFPILDSVSKLVKIPKLILWENIAIYIYWLYEKVLREAADADLRARSAEDFHYLIHLAPGTLFGNYHQNPLSRYFSNPVFLEESKSMIRVRKTCCFNFRTEGGDFCSTCPRVCKQQN